MDAYLASGFGLVVGVLAILGFLWWSFKKRPEWYIPARLRDTALTLTIVGLAFALLAVPVGRTYFLLWMFYGVALTLIGYGITSAVRMRRDPVESAPKKTRRKK